MKDYLTIAMIAITLFLLPWLWWREFKRYSKQRRDAIDLEWLEEMAQEHEAGTRDNSETLDRLIRSIEKEHEPSAALAKRLENVRRILKARRFQ